MSLEPPLISRSLGTIEEYVDLRASFAQDRMLNPLRSRRVPSTAQSLTSSPSSEMNGDDSDEEEFVYPGVEEEETDEVSSEQPVADSSEPELHPEAEAAEVFIYPGVENGIEELHEPRTPEPTRSPTPPYEPEAERELPAIPVAPPEPEVIAQVTPPSIAITPPPQEPIPTRHPSATQLEAIQTAASSGDLVLLRQLFRSALHTGEIEPFALANDASPRTGLTALHAAASRGRLEIVKWRTSDICDSQREKSDPYIVTVMEECGAIPDIEDKEGEVGKMLILSCLLTLTRR